MQPQNGTSQPQSPPAPAKPPAPAPKRMSLADLVRGKIQQSSRVLLYGPEGIGKSTFAAGAPRPVFIDVEKGSGQIDVPRFPMPADFNWQDLLDAVHELTTGEHEFGTVVIDTADAAEALLWAWMCKRDSTQKDPIHHIEDYGYGKGYAKALDEWRVLLAALERLRSGRKMNVIFLAHSWIKPFKNPQGEDFDRYELKLHAKAAGLLKEWSDTVLFAAYETYAFKDERTKRVRGVSTGERVIFTQRTAAYDAKNRYDLPDQLPLSWADFEAARAGRTPDKLRAEIAEKAKAIEAHDVALAKTINEWAAKAGDAVHTLVVILNKATARASELESQKGN